MGIDQKKSSPSGAAVLVVEDEYYLAREMADHIERVGGSVIGPFATTEKALAGWPGPDPIAR